MKADNQTLSAFYVCVNNLPAMPVVTQALAL